MNSTQPQTARLWQTAAAMVVAAALFASACSGDDGFDSSVTSETQTVSEPTTTAVAPTPTQAQPPIDASETANYLADVFDINADLVDDQLRLGLAGYDPAGLSDLWRDAFDDVATLDPPTSLATAHEQWLTFLATFADEFDVLAVAAASSDPVELEQATEQFLSNVATLSLEITEIDRVQADATIETLATIDTPEAVYVALVIQVQRDSDEGVQEIFASLGLLTTDPEAALQQMLDAFSFFDGQLEVLDSLDVPASATDLHARRADALRSMAEVTDIFATSLQSSSGPSGLMVTRMNELAAEAQVLNADWSRYVAATLRN